MLQANNDELTDAKDENIRVRAPVSRLINLVRDYETEESVDHNSPNLAADAANAGRQLLETIQRSEQNLFCETEGDRAAIPLYYTVTIDYSTGDDRGCRE